MAWTQQREMDFQESNVNMKRLWINDRQHVVCTIMELWLHDQMFQSARTHTHSHTCIRGVDASVPTVWSIGVPLRRIDWSHVEWGSVCVCVCVSVCVTESLLISYGCLLLRSIAVSLHKVVLTVCAIWNPSIHQPASVYTLHAHTHTHTTGGQSSQLV